MKTIIVLTDFSKNARLAAEAALSLAPEIGADILLFHCYLRSLYFPALVDTGWPPECYSSFKSDSEKALEEEVNHLEKMMADKANCSIPVKINYLNSEGSLTDNIPQLLKKYEAYLIFMGGRTKNTGDFIFGNDIQDVIYKTNCPVLIVPEGVPEFKNIAFASDLSKQDILPLVWLMEFADNFNAKINVCHVSKPTNDTLNFGNENVICSFINEIAGMRRENISFTDITGNHIVEELEKFCSEKNQDLLALVYKKHSLFWRMLHESPARNLIQQQKNVILILPEKGTEKDQSAPLKVKITSSKKQSLRLL